MKESYRERLWWRRKRIWWRFKGVRWRYRDPLTRLPTYRRLRGALRRSFILGRPIVLVGFDIDGLRGVNVYSGFAFGDDVIRRVAAALVAALPTRGALYRVGGDEFAALLPGASAADAHEWAQAAARGVSENVAVAPDVGPLTLKFAIAASPPGRRPSSRRDVSEFAHSAFPVDRQRATQMN